MYYGTNGKELPNECATVAQETMYENYQKYIQQLTVSDCSNNEKLCPVEDLPKRYKFFTDWTYRRKFNDLDKIWKDKLLGWTQVRKELFFKMADGMRALKYLERYSSKLAFKLGNEYITFMNDHMQSTKIYYTENYASDFKGVLPKKRSDELFPLSTSRSATQLHDKLMKLYN